MLYIMLPAVTDDANESSESEPKQQRLNMKDAETLRGDANSGEQSQMSVYLCVCQISPRLNLETLWEKKQGNEKNGN